MKLEIVDLLHISNRILFGRRLDMGCALGENKYFHRLVCENLLISKYLIENLD